MKVVLSRMHPANWPHRGDREDVTSYSRPVWTLDPEDVWFFARGRGAQRRYFYVAKGDFASLRYVLREKTPCGWKNLGDYWTLREARAAIAEELEAGR